MRSGDLAAVGDEDPSDHRRARSVAGILTPGRPPLLEERAQALLALGRDARSASVSAVSPAASADGPPATRPDERLGRGHRLGPAGEHAVDARGRTSASSALGLDHGVHEADLPGALGGEAGAGQEQLARGRPADLRHDIRRDHRRHDAQPDLREAEHGISRGDHDVADGGEAGAAAERGAVHAADEREGQRVEHG